MNILAIDPGKSGGICVMYGNGALIGQARRHYDVRELPLCHGLPDVGTIQTLIIGYNVKVVVLERQQIRSRQRGQLSIGIGYGMLKATAILCGVEVVELRPQDWQNTLNLSGDKQEHIDYAEAAGFDIPWTSYKKNGEPTARANKHDGIADAVCIALAYREMVKRND